MANPISSFVVDMTKTMDDYIYPEPSPEYPGISLKGTVFFNSNEEEDEETHEIVITPQYRFNFDAQDLVSQAAAAFGVETSEIVVTGDLTKNTMEIDITVSGPIPK